MPSNIICEISTVFTSDKEVYKGSLEGISGRNTSKLINVLTLHTQIDNLVKTKQNFSE